MDELLFEQSDSLGVNKSTYKTYLRAVPHLNMFTANGIEITAKRFDVPIQNIYEEINLIKAERAVPVPKIPKKKPAKKHVKKTYIEYDEAFLLSAERNGLRALNQLALAAKRRNTESKFWEYLKIQAYTDGNTNDLTKCIIEFIRLNGYQAERISTTGRVIDKRTYSKDDFGNTKVIGSTKWIKSSGTLGSADISATIRGLSVKIEVKFGKDVMSKDQELYKCEIEQASGIYVIAKTFQEFYEWYKSKFGE